MDNAMRDNILGVFSASNADAPLSEIHCPLSTVDIQVHSRPELVATLWSIGLQADVPVALRLWQFSRLKVAFE
jgi:hypothetical protein